MSRKFELTIDEDGEEALRIVDQLSKLDDVKIVEPGFETVTRTTDVAYDAKVFLSKAYEYFRANPCDLVQAAEKTWGAASYTLQAYCLEVLKVNLASHNAMRFFLRLVLDSCDTAANATRLQDAWKGAENCHKYFNGNGGKLHKTTFEGRHADVTWLVQFLSASSPNIDHDGVRKKLAEVVQMIEASGFATIHGFTIRMNDKAGTRVLAGKAYPYSHKFY